MLEKPLSQTRLDSTTMSKNGSCDGLVVLNNRKLLAERLSHHYQPNNNHMTSDQNTDFGMMYEHSDMDRPPYTAVLTGEKPELSTSASHQSSFLPGQKSVVVDNIRPVLRLMQFWGFFPLSLRSVGGGSSLNRGSASCGRCYPSTCLFALVALAFLGVNAFFVQFNSFFVYVSIMENGMLSVFTISSIITGLKPLHILFNLGCAMATIRYHKALLKCLDKINRNFQQSYKKVPSVRSMNIEVFVKISMVFLTVMSIRAGQYIFDGTVPFEKWLVDLSVVLVPVLAVWQILPLFYFDYLARMVSKYFKQLTKQLSQDLNLEHQPLEKYYNHYLMLTHYVFLLGRTMNPFVFFSLAISMCVLCLTIYFVTQAKEVIPANAPDALLIIMYFQIGWSAIQIFIACSYMVQICVTGTRTNESCRKILSTVMKIIPDTDRERHVAQYFVQKIQCHNGWGLTVWGAFPIERPLLFTLTSIMATYAVVLLKMKKGTTNCNNEDILEKLDNLTDYLGQNRTSFL